METRNLSRRLLGCLVVVCQAKVVDVNTGYPQGRTASDGIRAGVRAIIVAKSRVTTEEQRMAGRRTQLRHGAARTIALVPLGAVRRKAESPL